MKVDYDPPKIVLPDNICSDIFFTKHRTTGDAVLKYIGINIYIYIYIFFLCIYIIYNIYIYNIYIYIYGEGNINNP